MKLSTVLVPIILACGTLAEDFFRFAPGGMFDKRVSCGRGDTCREACGGGATECGPNGYCYDPTLGETCCGDSGYYCAAGKYCAPIVGYCCLNGETADECAIRQTLTFPAVTVSATSFSSAAAPSVVETTSTPEVESSSSIFVPFTSAPSLTPTTSLTNASLTGATLTTGPAQFTGAAVQRDGSIGAFFMGALGLLAAAL